MTPDETIDDLPGLDFDNGGITSFYGTCAPGIVSWGAAVDFDVPISEQYASHLRFE